MALTNSWPGVNGAATTTDARKNLAGLIETDASGVVRSGVFPAGTGAIVTARADMNVGIAIFQGVTVQFSGPILIANDGVAQLPSVLVSPGSGTNYYVIYAKQNESTAPGTDASNTKVFGAQLSTSSFAAARAAMPTGALELATVQMPTGKTATNNVGVTITQTFQYTATDGGIVLLRNQTEQDAWLPADGSQAFRLDTQKSVQRVNGAWATMLGEWVAYTPTLTASTTNPSLGASTLTGQYSRTGDLVHFRIFHQVGTGATGGSGVHRYGLPFVSAVAGTPNFRTPAFASIEAAGVQYYAGIGYIEAGNQYIEQIAYGPSTDVVSSGSGFALNTKIALSGTYRV